MVKPLHTWLKANYLDRDLKQFIHILFETFKVLSVNQNSDGGTSHFEGVYENVVYAAWLMGTGGQTHQGQTAS